VGIPKDSVLRYETVLKANKFMIIVHGDADIILRTPPLVGGILGGLISGVVCPDQAKTVQWRLA
jgi:hypothetical protein